MDELIKPEDCKHYNGTELIIGCSAPICPLDKNYIWYPDDEICRAGKFATIRIIKNQKRIAKRCKNKDYFFTAAMLDRNIIIKTGIEGLNPDAENVISDQDAAEKDWIEKHPVKKELSEEKKEELRERFKSALASGNNSAQVGNVI